MSKSIGRGRSQDNVTRQQAAVHARQKKQNGTRSVDFLVTGRVPAWWPWHPAGWNQMWLGTGFSREHALAIAAQAMRAGYLDVTIWE